MKLRQCPFCAGTAVREFNAGRYGYFGYIRCEYCGGTSGTKKIIPENKFSSEDEFWGQEAFIVVSKLWNQRKRKMNDK